MAANPAEIVKFVIADTCAVWNILSSAILHRACKTAGFTFTLTSFIAYECLHKRRANPTQADNDLINRLREAQAQEQFKTVDLTVDDLQDVARLELRKKLSKGELSAIAFSRRTRLAFQTDDRGARKLALQVLP